MNIEIWSVGKSSDAFIEEGIRFYQKRLAPFCNVAYSLLPPPKRSVSMPVEQMKKAEEKIILNRLQPHHYLVLLDEKGQSLSSLQWAEQIGRIQTSNVKTLVFLIGGPWGVTEAIKEKARQIWSLSALTFPHQLVRLIMAEQLYRSFSILNHSGYHHE